MEVVYRGRNSEISERFKSQVTDKLHRIEKFDSRQRIIRVEVQVTHEKNPRDPATSATVELTVVSRGPVVRAEATAADQYSALDAAMDRLTAQLRKVVDRLRDHRPAHHVPADAAAQVAAASDDEVVDDPAAPHKVGSIDVVGDGPLVMREKTHSAAPMTLDQALYEMELVGHDFFLFVEKDSMYPSVVYRRRGYDYGVIRLTADE